jgi:hypothetical protein
MKTKAAKTFREWEERSQVPDCVPVIHPALEEIMKRIAQSSPPATVGLKIVAALTRSTMEEVIARLVAVELKRVAPAVKL